jgi:predicted AlkP superfamily phosphohydrolase/phosphomutase
MSRVLAIFLDGYDVSLGRRLMAAGEMPEMSRLAAASARFLLKYGAAQRVGLTGEHVATGLSPEAARRWSVVQFDPRTYAVWQEGTWLRPFAADLNSRTVVFDVPYFDLNAAPRVDGIVSWGSHAPGVAQGARPSELRSELVARFGTYPAERWIYGFAWPSVENSRLMGVELARAVDLRAEAARWLLAERLPDWDLALIAVSEPHSASEALWHGIDPAHPLHHLPSAGPAGAGLRAVYHAVDRLIGALSAAFPDAVPVVFSMGGMGPNKTDLQSMLLLPEVLYRQAFGSTFFRQQQEWGWRGDGSPVLLSADDDDWEVRIATGFPKPPPAPESQFRRFASRVLPRPAKTLIRRMKARSARPESQAGPLRQSLDWMPAAMYQPHWKFMPAFALPSSHDGRVRVNLVGREAHGRVRVENYRQVLEEVERLARDCSNPATGESAVDFVEYPAPRDPRALATTQADLIIVWKDSATCFEHPTLGRVGPVPYRRTGGHTGPYGMAYIRADDRPAGDHGIRSSFDVVPTIIDLMGQAPLRWVSGASLFSEVTSNAR